MKKKFSNGFRKSNYEDIDIFIYLFSDVCEKEGWKSANEMLKYHMNPLAGVELDLLFLLLFDQLGKSLRSKVKAMGKRIRS